MTPKTIHIIGVANIAAYSQHEFRRLKRKKNARNKPRRFEPKSFKIKKFLHSETFMG